MTCPFPGVDPWLERSPFWQGFHNSFLTYLRDALRPLLPEGYRTSLEVRVYVDHEGLWSPAIERIPDVEVYRSRSEGGAAVADRPQVSDGLLLGGPGVERREAWLGVRSLPNDELVTAIKLLSPSNKRPGAGRASFREKQTQLAAAGVNLVEIDLLRGGDHTVHFPREWLDSAACEYLVAIYRAKWPGYSQVIPWGVRDPLPHAPIPLGGEAEEPRLDLQSLYERTYDNGDFSYFLRDRHPLEPRLTPDDQEWASRLVSGRGWNPK